MDIHMYNIKVTDDGMLIPMVAIRAPDRWIVYPLAPHDGTGLARGVAYSYPHRGPALTDASAEDFTFVYLRVNRHETNALVPMAILAVLRDTEGPVPDTLDIKSKRLLLVAARASEEAKAYRFRLDALNVLQ